MTTLEVYAELLEAEIRLEEIRANLFHLRDGIETVRWLLTNLRKRQIKEESDDD